MLGVVVDFDVARGLGTIGDDARRSYRFHSAEITDGTRTIEAGTRVAFTIAAVPGGEWEAVGVVPVGSR